ncbi:copper homeostasis protein CutC [Heyndrickxia sporothermodurans]|nr:copper homeostasis protein CutC [Heyndrickxia sporothermodurans]
MIIEVITDSVNDSIIAEQAGANRIELITGVHEGGLTPSYGLIEGVCKAVSIPVNVMIRPHSRSFRYSNEEINMMALDIKVCKDLGATGVVFGVLTEDNHINENALKYLIDASNGLDITFHRAFDEVENQFDALKIIQKYPEISRILTSGGEDKAIQAIEQLHQLTLQSGNVEILAGSGLNPTNLSILLDKVKVKEIHFGTGVRYQNSFMQAIDPDKIKEIIHIATTYGL